MVITPKKLAAHIPEIGVSFVLQDDLRTQLAGESDLEPDVGIDAASPACLIYRSSKSGRQLGVVVPHRALCAPALPSQVSSDEVHEFNRVAHACTFSREVAVIEIFRTLARGDCVVDIPVQPLLAPRKLASLIQDQKVTTLWISASALEPLAREFPWTLNLVRQIFCEDRPEELAQLREKLKTDLAQRVHGVHGYTEAGGSLYVYPLASSAETAMHEQRLAPGIRLYVLDSAMKPAASGVLGELFVGGDSVALGYAGDAEHDLTSFLADPFSERPWAKMYRTGDWARLHPQGILEYRGRRDRQVIRAGLRVQMEEIESALLRYEGIKQVAVDIPRTSGETKSDLAALVVTADGQVISEQDMRTFLLQKLPQAMVPKSITQVEKIVRTAQGKVIFDQKAYVAPRSTVEREIAQIWSELLEVEQVSIYDDFFRLGGHSLLAVKLKTMLHDRLQWEMPLADLFRATTIAGLAELMAKTQETPVVKEASTSILVEIQAGGALTPMFFVHPVGGSVLSYVELARELGPEQPFYAIQSPGGDAEPEHLATFEQMAQLYIQAIQRVQPSGPYQLGGWSLGGLLAWEIARQLTAIGESVGMLALIDTYPPSRAQTEPGNDSPSMLALFADDMARMFGGASEDESKQFQQLGLEQQLIFVQDGLAKYGIVPKDRAQQETAALLKVFTRNVQAMEDYQLRRVDQHVVLVAAAEADAPEQLAGDWKKWAGGGVNFSLVPGNHYSMIRQPNVAAIAEALQRGISETAESAGLALAGTVEP
jgi:thioesterase domain-containing protein/acyl carrier protein